MTESKNNEVLVIGGGIAGGQAALLLAEKGHRVHVLESGPAVGGYFPLLEHQFPTNSCGVCFMNPKPQAFCPIYETQFHENIELLTNCRLADVTGEAGNFEVTYTAVPRHVDPAKCTLCGKCVDVCPVSTKREFGGGLEERKAIHLPFPQAIPRSYVIDRETCTRCGACVKVCEPGAITLDGEPEQRKLAVGAIMLGAGFLPFAGEQKGEFGMGRYPNVISGIQYEWMLSNWSKTGGVPWRPSDGKAPRRVAFLQCVGSRDVTCGHGYCSSVCCMYATKQAMISRDRRRDLAPTIFYMDMRTMGKGYERYLNAAKKEYAVRYVRCAVSTVRELKRTNNLLVEYGLDNGEMRSEEFDLVVLSVGLTPPPGLQELAQKLGVALNDDGFCAVSEFDAARSSVPGVFVAGTVREPQDIPETVTDACGAAAAIGALLDSVAPQAGARSAGRVEQKLLQDYVPRVGVFVCEHKGMLGARLDLAALTDGIRAIPRVRKVETLDVGALEAAVRTIGEAVSGSGLNRVVLAGYRGHELERALGKTELFGICGGLCEVVNIGEQCADVHTDNGKTVAEIAVELVRAGVCKARYSEPETRGTRAVEGRVLVVGGGVAGMAAALSLAEQGIPVTLVEKDARLGGNAVHASRTLKGSNVPPLLEGLRERAENNAGIEILTKTELKSMRGVWGDFQSVLAADGEDREFAHGAVIFATGGKEVQPDEYLYGQNDRVVTQRGFEKILHGVVQGPTVPAPDKLQNVVMIQCVGSREEQRPHCSRVCCGHAVKNALALKERNPAANIYVLYRDVRTYGYYEHAYREARAKGVVFVRYDVAAKPEVRRAGKGLCVAFNDPIVDDRIELDCDMLVLSVGIEPGEDTAELARVAGLKRNADGFFAEANPKAAPLDAVDRGKYFCGLCHSPQHIEEALIQGRAAAARAAALLWQGAVPLAENRARVNEARCVGCGACVAACRYGAPSLDPARNIATVDETLCTGCGVCAAACRSSAIDVSGFGNEQVLKQLEVM